MGRGSTEGGTANDHLSHQVFVVFSLVDHTMKAIGAFSIDG